MDSQNIPSSPQPIEPVILPPKPKSSVILIILLILLLSAVGIGAYYLGIKQSKSQTYILPSQAPTSIIITPTIFVSKQPIITEVIPIKLDKDKIKNEIETSTNPKMIVEALDISPTDTSLVGYLGHNDQWNKFGIYFFNTKTAGSSIVFESTENITGRGGHYMDNTALEFSPSGEAFFVNRTGINFPSFFIINSKGNILYKSNKDVGHATWVSGQKLIYLGDGSTKPQVYDITTNKSDITQLPDNIFHLKANSTGTKIAAFSITKNPLQCESFYLHIYNYPEGTEIKSIPNTSLTVSWIDENVISYEKITSCKKNTGESMFEFSPVIEKQQIFTQ